MATNSMASLNDSSCQAANDNVLGPIVHGCRDNFDFTLLFEQSILSIAPSALLILLALARILYLLRCRAKTNPTLLRYGKIGTIFVLLGTQIALLVLWVTHSATKASIPAAVLNLVAGFIICCLSFLEHDRSVQPSTLLGIYLCLSLLFDITIVRTLYLRAENRVILGLSTTSIATKIVLLMLETWNKRASLREPYNKWSKEVTSGVINRTFFWWLNPLFHLGYRHNLTAQNLYPLDPDLLSDSLEESMAKSWAAFSSSGRYALVKTSMWSLRWPLFLSFFPRLCLIGLSYCQPFLITAAVAHIGNPSSGKNDGYGLVGATFFIYLGIAVFTAHYQHRTFRTISMFRGAMVSLIYSRTLELQAGVYDNMAAITLMSTDIDRIAGNISTVQDLWSSLISIGIGIWLLERQLGWVCIAPIVVTMICTYGAIKVAKLVGPAQRLWMGSIQTRVGMTSAMLASMKSVKLRGLSEILTSSIQDQRIRELNMSVNFRWLSICRSIVSITPGLLGPLVTFAIFAIQATVQHSDGLSTSQAFTSLAIISLLTTPAQSLLSSLPSIKAALACFDRIQTFLLAENLADDRIIPNSSPISSDEHSIELQMLDTISSDIPAVSVNGASFRPSKDSPLALHDVSFRSAKGSLTMIVGAVGSGKSTLLKAILGELKCDAGTIEVSSTRMAYCSQTSWIQNATIRQIICGHSVTSEDEDKFYHAVVYSCAFDEDILQLPNGHDTLVGSRGFMLSGGQKQRLALARAAYARKDIIILDDILSALDSNTEGLILERLLGKTGLFSQMGSTVILATHAVQHLGLADHVVLLDPTGNVVAQGKFEELKSQASFVNNITLPAASTGKKKSPKPPAKTKPLPKSLQGPSQNDRSDLTRRTGDVSLYRYYFASIGWKLSLALVVTLSLNTLASSFPQVWLKWYTDGTIRGVGLFAGVYAAFVLIALFMTAASMAVMYLKAVPKSGAGLHKILLTTVMQAPQSFFDKTDTGVILNKFSQDMSLVDGSLPVAVIITMQALFNCVAMAALISLGSSYMGLTVLGLLFSLYFLQNIYLRTSRQIRFLDLEAKSPLYTHFLETLEGLSTIRAFGWKQAFKTTGYTYLDRSQQPHYLMYCIQRWLTLVLQLIIGAMAVLVVGLAVNIRSTTNAGNLGIALTTILSFNTNVQFLLTWWTTMETSLGAISRTRSFAQQTPSERAPQETFVPSDNWPDRGDIELRDISASYGPDMPVLHGISLHIAAGEKIGICGRTGSGKSSLLSILVRCLDFDTGTILIDGLDVSTIPREIIRKRLVAIPQDPCMLKGTIRFNADPTNSSSDEQIIAVMTKVKLWEALASRGGLDADMSKQPLSQGQQQLFCVGAALLRTETKILLLDEATSSMDLEIDRLIRELIREEFRECTVITIAHRSESLLGSDRVVVLDHGVIAEVGRPRELLETDSMFKRLYSQGS